MAAAALPEPVPAGPLIPDNPLFEEFQDKLYPDDLLNELYALSQYKEIYADIKIPVEETEGVESNFHKIVGFEQIITLLLLQHLDKSDTVLVTPGITIIGNSFTYKKGKNNDSIAFVKNESFRGIININTFKKAYNAQTKKQENTNRYSKYTAEQDKKREALYFYRTDKLMELNLKSEHNTNTIKKEQPPVYNVAFYSLFSKETFDYFTNLIYRITHILQPTTDVIVIPINLHPFLYNKPQITGHAQYILIHKSQKTYTIIDGQFDHSREYRELLIRELRGIEPLIQKCMGSDEFQPYLYHIQCPQAILKDRNCIWWSTLIMYLYIKSDLKTVELNILLQNLKDASKQNPAFLFRLLTSFKVFILESIILPRLLNDTIRSTHLNVFFHKYFPEIRGKIDIDDFSVASYNLAITSRIPKNSIHGLRNAARGGTRKLKGRRLPFLRTHTRKHGKLIRKSHRR